MRFDRLGTFAHLQLSVEQLLAAMPDAEQDALLAECREASSTNCAWYVYGAAQWIQRPLVRLVERRDRRS